MRVRVKAKVEGLRELNAALQEMSKAARKGVLRRVATKALEPMAATARELAPDDPDTAAPNDLRSSIIVSSKQRSGRSRKRSKEGNSVQVHMGPTSDGYPQAMVQEFGAAAHNVAKGARKQGRGKSTAKTSAMHPGHAPNAYMRPAWDQHAETALAGVKSDLTEEIEKHAKRAAAKAARLARKAGR